MPSNLLFGAAIAAGAGIGGFGTSILGGCMAGAGAACSAGGIAGAGGRCGIANAGAGCAGTGAGGCGGGAGCAGCAKDAAEIIRVNSPGSELNGGVIDGAIGGTGGTDSWGTCDRR